jgi:mannitol-specific phosphotransferase system IIBC component
MRGYRFQTSFTKTTRSTTALRAQLYGTTKHTHTKPGTAGPWSSHTIGRSIMTLLTAGWLATGHPTSHRHVATQRQDGALWCVQIAGAIGMVVMGLACLAMLRKSKHRTSLAASTMQAHRTQKSGRRRSGNHTQAKMATQKHAQSSKMQNNQHHASGAKYIVSWR